MDRTVILWVLLGLLGWAANLLLLYSLAKMAVRAGTLDALRQHARTRR